MNANAPFSPPTGNLLLIGGVILLFVLYFGSGSQLLLIFVAIALLLFAMSTGVGGGWRWDGGGVPAPYWRLAAGIGTALLVVGLAPPVFYDAFFWAPGYAPAGESILSILALLMTLAAAVAPLVAVRRFWTGVLLAMGLPVLLAFLADGHAFAMLGVISLLACGLCASWVKPSAPWIAGTVALAPVLYAIWAAGELVGPMGLQNEFLSHRDLPYLLITSALFAAAFLGVAALGMLWRPWVVRNEMAERALARAGQVEEHSAVVEERARLARDLHDVVAHHVSLIAVRAETAPYTHPTLDAQARTVLGDIAADARLALDELRGVLGILGRSGESDRSPQPAWGDIPALVERTRAAGLSVTLDGDTSQAVSPSVGYAAYRVVQEGLTNARKHAPGAPVTVALEATDRLVHVSIRNALTGSSTSGSGSGLVGMRERVTALGGRMSAGPVGGEYVVDVTLPAASTGEESPAGRGFL